MLDLTFPALAPLGPQEITHVSRAKLKIDFSSQLFKHILSPFVSPDVHLWEKNRKRPNTPSDVETETGCMGGLTGGSSDELLAQLFIV